MSGAVDVQGLKVAMEAAADAAEGVAGRPMLGLRPVRPGTGGLSWLVAFTGPAFLCMDELLRPEESLARVRDVAQANLASEVIDEMVDSDALRALRPHVDVLAGAAQGMPAAVDALRRCVDASEALAQWGDAPERIIASLVALDEAVLIQGRAHAAYATFASVTEPLVQRQDELPATLLSALVAVEQAASAAGLGASLGGMLGEGMGGIVEAADEMARGHLTPLR
jgi:hypothetical protein